MTQSESVTPRRFDLQDALLALGIALLAGGVAAIYWPAALILGGVIALLMVALIERAKHGK